MQPKQSSSYHDFNIVVICNYQHLVDFFLIASQIFVKWQPLGHDMETMYLFHHLGYEYAQRLFYVPYR